MPKGKPPCTSLGWGGKGRETSILLKGSLKAQFHEKEGEKEQIILQLRKVSNPLGGGLIPSKEGKGETL